MELRNQILQGDALHVLKTIPDNSVDCVVTSPPYYGQRDYGVDGQIGLEQSPREFVDKLVAVFREVRRVLKPTGTLWLNIGDSYATGSGGYSTNLEKQKSNHGTQIAPRERTHGYKEKDLMMIPARVAIALQDDGWYLRSEIVWHKANPVPESVKDRPTKAHEMVYLLTKAPSYWYDADAIAEPIKTESYQRAMRAVSPQHKNLNIPGQTQHTLHKARANGEGYQLPEKKNARDVWFINPEPTPFAHFATFPQKLVERCILAGCPVGGVVLDPFGGACTTALVARQLRRDYTMIELNPTYIQIGKERLRLPFEAHHIQPENGDLSTLPLFAALGDSNGNKPVE